MLKSVPEAKEGGNEDVGVPGVGVVGGRAAELSTVAGLTPGFNFGCIRRL